MNRNLKSAPHKKTLRGWKWTSNYATLKVRLIRYEKLKIHVALLIGKVHRQNNILQSCIMWSYLRGVDVRNAGENQNFRIHTSFGLKNLREKYTCRKKFVTECSMIDDFFCL